MNTRIKPIYAVIAAIVILSLTVVSVLILPRDSTRADAAKNAGSSPPSNRPTGTITFSDWQFPDTLNPYQTALAVSQEVQNGMFENLFMYDQKARLVPQLARELPTVANGGIKNDGKTIVVHLKKGLRWSNGAELTSADVKFGWHVGMDKTTGPYCKGSCDVISRIDTPDKHTAIFHLKQVYAPALSYAVNGFLLWPHVWAGAWKNDPHAAGLKLAQDIAFNFESPAFPTNGAYQVKEFVKDNRILLQPMTYYNGMSRGAHIQNLIFVFYSSKAGMVADAINGATDVTQNYTAADLPSLKQHNDAFRLHVDPGFTFEHLEFNLDSKYHGKANPLANRNVRLALALSLDKVGLIRSALGLSPAQAKDIAAWTPLVNTSQLTQPFADTRIKGQWDPISKRFVADTGRGKALAKAKQLLSMTEWKNGFTLDVSSTTGNPVRKAQTGILTQNWAKLGVKVNPVYVPASRLFSGWGQAGPLNHGDFQVAMFAFLGSPDPDQLKYNLEGRYVDRKAAVHSEINQNYSGIHNVVIDRAFEKAAHTVNGAERARQYATAQVELNKLAYWVPLYFRPTIATDSGKVANFSNNPTQTGPTWNMFAWKVKSAR